ncbi:uncharacterized protein BCR38DRAFT_488489 [Pseudomassariella vexata]|uniref:Uncharacterized protein n=1 Tax=Pseudomassariella vexata TaxID=1141098 RepID=A0A1Y2DJZ3_9PEZI|nr:uncharacterized protein BCR38DRAFT_488489 [Pseudomassariella vexata]ORY59464.1 hypothetical protein BCR38DRAFT_488489 [Pseudomassariella vexata]
MSASGWATWGSHQSDQQSFPHDDRNDIDNSSGHLSGLAPESYNPILYVSGFEPGDGSQQPASGQYHQPCTHQQGPQWCFTHSESHLYSHMPQPNNSYGISTPGETQQGAGSPPGINMDERGLQSLPPSVDRYIQDSQQHELVACSMVSRHVRKSEKRHRTSAQRRVEEADLGVYGRHHSLDLRLSLQDFTSNLESQRVSSRRI